MTDWEQHYATAAGYRYWPNEELVRFVGDRRFGTVIEVGCGNGANLWFLAEHAAIVYGCDPCEAAQLAARELCAARGTANVSIHADDARNLTDIVGGADLVVDCMVSQHLGWAGYVPHDTETPKVLAFREYHRVLRHGGQLFLYHLNNKSVGLDRLFPDVKIYPADEASMSWTLEDIGFRGVSRHSLTRTYPGGRGTAAYTIITAEAVK